MSLYQMREEYEQIRSNWRSRPPAEHGGILAQVKRLHQQAEESPEEGTEQLAVELEDLLGQLGHGSPHQHGVPQPPRYNEPSDAM